MVRDPKWTRNARARWRFPRAMTVFFQSLRLVLSPFGGFLVHEDFVATQIFKYHPSAVGTNLRFAVKFYAQLFHSLVVTEAILGLYRKVWVAAACLPSNAWSSLVRARCSA